jgi:hypothetical protein
MSWTATGAGYRLYSRSGNRDGWELLSETTGTSARAGEDFNVGWFGSRQFRVTAVTSGTESDPSGVLEITRRLLSYSCEAL